MVIKAYSHLVEINEEQRMLCIYRIYGEDKQLFTSVKLPEIIWNESPAAMNELCRILGENILIDSPQARNLFKL